MFNHNNNRTCNRTFEIIPIRGWISPQGEVFLCPSDMNSFVVLFPDTEEMVDEMVSIVEPIKDISAPGKTMESECVRLLTELLEDL